jgi:hypothetical protein
MLRSSAAAAPLAVLAMALGVRAVAAQDRGLDTVGCGAGGSRDTLRIGVYVWSPPRAPHEPGAEYAFRRRQAEIVARQVDSITVTALPEFLGTALVPCGAPERYRLPDLDGELFFQVRDDGRLAALSLDPRSGSPDVNHALVRAALRADSLRLLQPLPRGLRGIPVGLRLAVATAPPDTLTAWRVGRVVLPYRPVDEAPRLQPGWRRPAWPDVALWAMAGDSVGMDFIIGTDGRVVMNSIRLRSGTWREFADQAVASASTFRFTPARSGGCAVPLRYRFTFVWDWRERRD